MENTNNLVRSNHRFTYDEPTTANELAEFAHVRIAKALNDGVDKLIGDLLTITDLLGIPEAQHKALKKHIQEAFYKRYGATTDTLLTVVFGINNVLDPDSKTPYTVYTRHQNKGITGYLDDLEEQE